MQPDHLAADVHFAVRDDPVLVWLVQQPRCEAERTDEELVRCGDVPIYEQRHDVRQILHATIVGRFEAAGPARVRSSMPPSREPDLHRHVRPGAAPWLRSHRLRASPYAHQVEEALDRERRARIPVIAPVKGATYLDVTCDPPTACPADPVRGPTAKGSRSGGRRRRRPQRPARSTSVLYSSSHPYGALAGAPGELDTDRPAVPTARVPRDVLLADALDDRVGVYAVVRRHLGLTSREPLRHRLCGPETLYRLHGVDHDEVDRAPARAGHVGALDEWMIHGISPDRGTPQSPDSIDREIPTAPRLTRGASSLWDNARVTRQLWAPWRLSYVQQAGEQDGCVFCHEAQVGSATRASSSTAAKPRSSS